MNKKVISTVLAFILIGASLTIFSCKDPEPPEAEIYVTNEDGEAMEEAMVVIRAADSDSSHTMIYLSSGPKEIADTSYTDNDGRVHKKFKYEAIYRVEVTVPGDYNHPQLRGIGVLILENDKTIREDITVNPQTVFD